MSTESHNIAALRDRLALIESTQVNENPFKTGLQTMKNLFKGPKPAAPTPPSTTPSGTVYRATPNNPNASRAEVPGAPQVTKDLTGAPVNPGGISATGSVGAARAQTAADAQLATQRAASKDALGAMRPNPVANPTAATGVANALKNNPGKTAAAAATIGAVGGATMTGGSKGGDAGGAATKPTAGSLTPEERKELDALASELEVHMGKLPELDSLLLQHQQLVSGPTNTAEPGQPPSTAAKPEAGTIAGATKAIPSGAPVNPANPGGATSKYQPTPDEAKAALDNGSPRDIAALGGKERLQQLAGIPAQSGAATAPAQSNADSTNTSSSDW